MMNNIANVTDKAQMDLSRHERRESQKHTIVAIHVIVMMIRDIVMTTVDIRMIMIIVRIIADVMMNTMKMVIDTITIVTLDASNS